MIRITIEIDGKEVAETTVRPTIVTGSGVTRLPATDEPVALVSNDAGPAPGAEGPLFASRPAGLTATPIDAGAAPVPVE